MKKLFGALLVTSCSMTCFAGVGSTTDFAMTAMLGYEMGCEGAEDESKLIRTACAFGKAMKKAGISSEQAEKTLEVFAESTPKFDSICQPDDPKKGDVSKATDGLGMFSLGAFALKKIEGSNGKAGMTERTEQQIANQTKTAQ